jgi:hypothetical protein
MSKRLICLYSGPGAGKSSIAAGLYHELKIQDQDVELCREFVKDWVWESRPILPGDHIYFFGQQMRRELVLLREVDTVITDSPMLLTLEYEQRQCQAPYVMPALYEKYASLLQEINVTPIHIFINRSKLYNQKGRNETATQAKALDKAIKKRLSDCGIRYEEVIGNKYAVDAILKILKE